MIKYVVLGVILTLTLVTGSIIGSFLGHLSYLACLEKYSYFREMPKLYYPIVQVMCDEKLPDQYSQAGLLMGPLIGFMGWYLICS